MNKKNHSTFLSFSFSKGFLSPNLPIATFSQGDTELNFIIDTGSDDNVICKDILSQLHYETLDEKATLVGLGSLREVDKCSLSFQYEGENFTTTFIVSEDLKNAFDEIYRCHAIRLHGMIGSQFLRQNSIVLDFHTLTAYNKKV